jgi:hypothetical protein
MIPPLGFYGCPSGKFRNGVEFFDIAVYLTTSRKASSILMTRYFLSNILGLYEMMSQLAINKAEHG